MNYIQGIHPSHPLHFLPEDLSPEKDLEEFLSEAERYLLLFLIHIAHLLALTYFMPLDNYYVWGATHWEQWTLKWIIFGGITQ